MDTKSPKTNSLAEWLSMLDETSSKTEHNEENTGPQRKTNQDTD